MHKTSEHTVSPYQFILRNQRYYLMAYNEKWQNMGFYRLDRITDMRMTRKPATAIRSVKGYESGIDYRAIATSLPYMFTDKPEYVEFMADAGIIDQIVDWFGDNAVAALSFDPEGVGLVSIRPSKSDCAVDILHKTEGGYEIYEVKSSTELKDVYLWDVAYQRWVLEQ